MPRRGPITSGVVVVFSTTLVWAVGCGTRASGSDNKASALASARKTGLIRTSKPLKDLFTARAPAMPGPYAGLLFGMTRDQANKAAPAVFGGHLGRIQSREYPGVTFHEPYFDRKGLRSVTLYLPPEQAKEVLTAAWGQPIQIDDRGKPVFLWFNPRDRIRASLRSFNSGRMALDLHPYMPVGEFLGPSKRKLAFETTPLIGMAVDDVRKYYPERFHRKGKYTVDLKFLPTEYDFAYGLVDRTMVEVAHKDGKTTGFRFRLKYGTNPAAKDMLFDLLEEKFGKAKRQKHGYTGRVSWVFDVTPRVKVTDGKTFWYVLVGQD